MRMAPTPDPAILEALNLDPSRTKMVSYGGAGFSSVFKLSSTTEDGREMNFFVKTRSGAAAEVMFRGEHASLNAIHSVDPTFCPASHAHGVLSASNRFFLVTDFLDLDNSGPDGTGKSLAAKLAHMHTTPAPIPEGYDKPMFGFPVPTCCGPTEQDNSWKSSWAEFYAENRLRAILHACKGADGDFRAAVERVADEVVPRLIGEDRLDPSVTPVLVHGDLWSGNHGRGRIAGQEGIEEVVFDASCVYGHSEYELGIMRMFGGFGHAFWKEYEKLVPKTEPTEEWEDRIALYELYHHLNHFAIFGGGYRGGAMSIMKKLLAKYA